jgi:O-antigen/teichoic acid export membrane protein
MYWGGLLGVFALGLPFGAIGYAALGTSITWCVIVMVVALRRWGPLGPSWDRPAIVQSIRKQIGFGIQVNAGSMVAMLFEPLTKIVGSHVLGVRDVGLFDLGLKARNFVWGAFARALYPVFPLLAAQEDESRRIVVVEDLERLLLLVIVPISVIVLGLAWPIATIWIGSDIPELAITMGALTVTYLFGSTLVTPYYHLLIVRGETLRVALLHVVNVVVNLIGILISFRALGYFSLVVGSGSAIMLSFAVAYHHQYHVLGIRIVDRPGIVRTVIGLGVVGGSIAIGLAYVLPPIPAIVIIPILSGLLSVILYRYKSLLTRHDLDRYFGRYPRATRCLTSFLVRRESA